MNSLEMTDWIAEKSPWLLVLVVVGSVILWVLRLLADISETVSKLLGPVGRRWRESSARRFVRSGADYENMQKQIIYLYRRVHRLEYESSIDHGFRVEDENWHRRIDLEISGMPTRRTFQEYRSEYETMHPYNPPDVGEIL